MTGRLFAIVGPSGAGKDTLIAAARALRPDLHVVRRAITRPEAAGGEAFEGVSDAEFDARLARGDFALHWQAHGLRYGISHAELAPLQAGQDVLFNGSRAALAAASTAFPDLTVILITAPAPLLAARLAARGREAGTDVAARIARAALDIPAGLAFVEVANDSTPEIGAARLLAALQPVRA